MRRRVYLDKSKLDGFKAIACEACGHRPDKHTRSIRTSPGTGCTLCACKCMQARASDLPLFHERG